MVTLISYRAYRLAQYHQLPLYPVGLISVAIKLRVTQHQSLHAGDIPAFYTSLLSGPPRDQKPPPYNLLETPSHHVIQKQPKKASRYYLLAGDFSYRLHQYQSHMMFASASRRSPTASVPRAFLALRARLCASHDVFPSRQNILNQNPAHSDLFLVERYYWPNIDNKIAEFSSEFPLCPQVACNEQFIRLWQCCDGKTQDTTLNELADSLNCSHAYAAKYDRRARLANMEVCAGRGKRSRLTFLYTDWRCNSSGQRPAGTRSNRSTGTTGRR
ncbi:SgrR family transcriptional regulator [Salmonella enterica subsp. enterica]|nr:SgrR family transcriptional regulator [Salmonella enterica subsp. enterica]